MEILKHPHNFAETNSQKAIKPDTMNNNGSSSLLTSETTSESTCASTKLEDGANPSVQTSYEKSEKLKSAKRPWRKKAFLVFHSMVGIAMHDLFIYSAVHEGLEFWGPQWIFYCVLMALVPIISTVISICQYDSPLSKLLARPYFSTAAICAFMYVIIGALWIYDQRRSTIIVMGSIGFLMSMYHWFAVEYLCFRKSEVIEDDKTQSNTKVLEELA